MSNPETEQRESDYIASGGANCPVCKSTDIEGGPLNADGPIVTAEVSCNRCGATWTDIYQLTSIEMEEDTD